MNIRHTIITVLIIPILTGCDHGYKVEDDKVYYEYWNEGSGQGKRLIKQADAKTFQELSFDCDCSFEFGKDKDHLFIDGEVIEAIDPNTFQFIGNYTFRDKDSAYFFGFYNSLNDCVIKGINPDKIQLLKYPWAKAGNILIHGRDTVSIDDINEFVPLDDEWGKTKKHIVNCNQLLDGADVETFEVISSFQGKDKRFKYAFGFIAEDDFRKMSYKTFDFEKKDFCQSEPIVFFDTHDEPVSYIKDKNERIKVVEKLKLKGFTVKSITYSKWSGESKIIRASLTSKTCNCVVEKLYRYDYSKPSEIENIFEATERINCTPKEN